MEAGGRAGLGQSAGSRLGREMSANWFRPLSGNLATGLASTTPSFRSSWQSAVNAWRGVSRGTSGVENEDAEETPINTRVTSTEEGITQKGGQTNSVAARASSNVPAPLPAAKQDTTTPNAASQAEAQTQPNRLQWRSVEDTAAEAALTASTVINAADRSGRVDPDGVDAQSQRTKRDNLAHAANTDTQTLSSAADAPNWLPLAPVSVPPAPALPAQFARADRGTIDPAGNDANGIAGNAGAAGSGVRTIHTGPASPLRGKTQSLAARETSASSLDDASEPEASLRTASPASSESSAADAKRESSTAARVAAAGENLAGQPALASSANNLTHSELDGSAQPSAGSHAATSGTAQTSMDAAQEASQPTLERTASRSSAHSAAQETGSIATPVATPQSASVDAAAAALRSSAAAPVSAAPASGHAQVLAAASSATSAQDTFSALDRGSSLGTPAWTHAGGQHAEAGFRDPDLGWVGVRADLDTSGIHATLVPSSADAAQTLSGHLAGLSSHLVAQQASVASLSMASPGESGSENAMGQRMQQGAEGNAQGGTSEESQATPQKNAPFESSTSALAATTESGVPETHAYPGELRGTHISVMA